MKGEGESGGGNFHFRSAYCILAESEQERLGPELELLLLAASVLPTKVVFIVLKLSQIIMNFIFH